MKVIVFGGAGFLGSHVADALTEAGHDVTIFDQRPSAYLRPGQRMIQGDVLDAEAVGTAVAGQEAVYHFAGLADIDECLARPADTVRVNVLGCVQLLEAARLAAVHRFVLASSIYVNSDSGGFYRASKQACELYVEEYQRRFGLDYTLLRYGSLYGRRADERNSIYRYLRQAFVDRRIAAVGTGEEVREYIHVEDAARASLRILAAEFRNQTVVLTGHYPMRFQDLLRMIREIVGDDVQVDLRPPADRTGNGHYAITPYKFQPRIGKKLVSDYHLDMGQGLVDCLDEIHQAEQGSRLAG